MTTVFDELVTNAYEQANKPALENEAEYVAIIAGEPDLWYSDKSDDPDNPRRTMSFRWPVLVSNDPNMQLTSFEERKNVVKSTLWTYLGRVNPPASMNEEQVKEAFEAGTLRLDDPSPNLGFLAQTVGMERTGRFAISEFAGRAFIVRAKHVAHWNEDKRAMNIPAIQINLSRSYVDDFSGNRGPEVEIPAWYTESAESGNDEESGGSKF